MLLAYGGFRAHRQEVVALVYNATGDSHALEADRIVVVADAADHAFSVASAPPQAIYASIRVG